MVTIYLVCAVLGGTVLICQFVLTLVGIGGEAADDFGDAGGDNVGDDFSDDSHGSSLFFGVLSFRTMVAALTFFGLVGMATSSSEVSSGVSLGAAIAAGLAAMYAVHWMMLALHKLRGEGTVRVERTVGKTGSVYLTIPGEKSGTGKVTLNIQNRTMEYLAMTSGDQIPTGSRIVVVEVLGSDTVEVEATSEAASES